MFTAGLSIMFCMIVSSDMSHSTARECLDALSMCGHTLADMVEKLPDAKHYMVAFGALHRNVLKKMRDKHNLAQDPSETHSNSMVESSRYVDLARGLELPQSSCLDNLTGMYHNRTTELSPTVFPNTTQPDGGASMFSTNTSSFPANETSPNQSDLLQWAFLHDDDMWDMEAGLGTYAYGNLDELGWAIPSNPDQWMLQ